MRSVTRDKYSPTRSISSGYGYNYGGGGGGGSIGGTSPAASIDRLSTMSALPSTDYSDRYHHHHHHLLHGRSGGGGGGGTGGGGESLGGSRTSLDSWASSSYSVAYQTPVSVGGGGNNNYAITTSSNRYNNNRFGVGERGGANTLGRTSGSSFMRQANERRSLRLTPSSPPPAPLIAKPTVTMQQQAPIAVTLTPISNNRASALRASLRMKNPFSNLSSSFQPPVYERQAVTVSKSPPPPPSASATSGANKRPTVLQLFTSAFSRPSPVHNNNKKTTTTTTTTTKTPNPSQFQYQSPAYNYNNNNKQSTTSQQGRRSEPEGVESKLMTASCFQNWNQHHQQQQQPKSPIPPPRTMRPSR